MLSVETENTKQVDPVSAPDGTCNGDSAKTELKAQTEAGTKTKPFYEWKTMEERVAALEEFGIAVRYGVRTSNLRRDEQWHKDVTFYKARSKHCQTENDCGLVVPTSVGKVQVKSLYELTGGRPFIKVPLHHVKSPIATQILDLSVAALFPDQTHHATSTWFRDGMPDDF